MSDFDILVRARPDLGILRGKIVAIAENLAGSAGEEIDATPFTLLPGVIDSHVHFNEPGRTEWEGFASGSRAAAAGGTTTVFDMPLNAHPPTVDGASFDLKRAAAEKSSVVDFALWGGLIPGNIAQLGILRDRGVVGLKAFMSASGVDDFPCVDDAALRAGMRRAAELGLLVAVHAESERITSELAQQKVAASMTTVRDYLDSRPVAAELDAIRCALDLAAETGCRLHIVHVSCGSGVKLIVQARAAGVDVSCETCPHYLAFTDTDMERLGAVAKCAPPLRSMDEQQSLWRQLDHVTTVGSDHSPSPWGLKDHRNFFEVWGGMAGCQHLLPLLLDESREHAHALPLERIAELTSERVAERFSIRQKGGIALGKDADITFVDSSSENVLTADGLHYRHRQSPYVGRRIRGRVVRTILRGRTIYRNGEFIPCGPGRFVCPTSP